MHRLRQTRSFVILGPVVLGLLMSGCAKEEENTPESAVEKGLARSRSSVDNSSLEFKKTELLKIPEFSKDATNPFGASSDIDRLLRDLPSGKDPKSNEAASVQGIRLMNQGDFVKAESLFRQDSRENPQAWQPEYHLAICLFRQKKYAPASARIDVAKERCKEPEGRIDYLQGMIAIQLGNHREAIEAFDEAEKLDAADARMYASRGNAHLHERQAEKAKSDATKAIALDPEGFDSYYVLGVAQMLLGELDESAGTLQTAKEKGLPDSQYEPALKGLEQRRKLAAP